MLDKIRKMDRNEALEMVLEQKDIDEKTKNLLQGILYKIEVSYSDYKKAKVINKTEKQYIDEIIGNINKKCNKIITISFNDKTENSEVMEQLEKNKFYVDEKQIITYPIEEKLLYAIEKSINKKKIVSGKYGIFANTISNFIITGKNIDRVEVLRDFNGWSWTTIKQEIENIKANLVYQTLQILFGEEFIQNWTLDTDGIIGYFEILKTKISEKYGEDISEKFEKILEKISILNETKFDYNFKKENIKKLNELQEKIKLMNIVPEYVTAQTEEKKKIEKEIAEQQKFLNSEKLVLEEYNKMNKKAELQNKIISINAIKKKIRLEILELLNKIEEINNGLMPNNFMQLKEQISKDKYLYETIYYTKDEEDDLYIEFEKIFLQCFERQIKDAKSEDLIKLIYKFRYFNLLPFDELRAIKEINELEEKITEIKKELLKQAKKLKIISNNVPFEVWTHIFETRIIELNQLYYKIFNEYDKKYVQIFDEKISEEKFLINNIEKNKLNKKIKIFI